MVWRRLRKGWLAALAVLPAMAGLGEGEDGRMQSCPRKAERSLPVGSVMDIADGEPPCRVEFRETGILLEAVADGARPDPGRTVLVDSDGRFISANAVGWNGVISVWDSRGEYLHSFGRVGEGPGEFSARGMMSLFRDSRDNLHVRDGSLMWSVFTPEHEFVRRVPANVMGGLTGTTIILDDGSAVNGMSDYGRTRQFRVADSTGALQRAFGPVSDERGYRRQRLSYAGGDTFWAGPPDDGSDAYVLEEWGIEGELRQTLRRSVSWWRSSEEGRPSTGVVQLHIADNGLLYVLIWRPTDEYLREIERLESGLERVGGEIMFTPEAMSEQIRLRDALTEHVVEVIDTRAGELLASEVLPVSQAREIVPRDFFRGSLRGYRYRVGDDGLPFVEIVTLELVPRDAAGGPQPSG